MSDSSSENKLYSNARYRRKMVRDCIKGSDAIKRNNEIYLPMPTGFSNASSPDNSKARTLEADGILSTDLPWSHNNPAYSSYLHRARFPEIVSVARNGLVGTATNKKPVFKAPNSIMYLEEQAGGDDESIYEIFAEGIIEVLTAGNAFLFVDVDVENNKLFLNIIKAEDLIDWDEDSKNDELTFANIRRNVSKRSASNIFEKDQVVENYVYFSFKHDEKLDQSFVVQKYSNMKIDGAPIALNLQGVYFDKCPIFPIGSESNCAYPQTSPLAGLSEIALSIYKKDADLSNAQYMTCNPTLTITGSDADVDEDGDDVGLPHLIGSQVCLLVPSPDAKVFYPNTDTSALDHVRSSIQDLFQEALMYSHSIVGQEKKSAESSDTVRMRQGAQNATLVNIAYNVGAAIQKAIKFCARLHGADESSVSFVANTDFAEKYISPQLLSALVSAWIARGLSLETLLRNFKDAGIIPREQTVEEEMTRISSEAPQV